MILLKIFGKLFIIGEYLVIKFGNEVVIVVVDKFIYVWVKEDFDY